MWKTLDDAHFSRAILASHQITARVELWSQGARLSSAVQFTDGEVKDDWVISGVRRNLSLSVPPTDQWLDWLAKPGLELRPYRGVRFSPSLIIECPLGRYPLLMPAVGRPVGVIALDVDDYYQRVEQADYPYSIHVDHTEVVKAIAAQLLDDKGHPFPGWRTIQIDSPSKAISASAWLDVDRAKVINEWAKSFGLEVYLDREGIPVIADARKLGTAQTSLLTGDTPGAGNGTVETLAITPDWDRVFNVIAVSSSVSGVDFPPVVAAITDVTHPAAPWRIGIRVKAYKSNTILTIADARKAAPRLLQKIAGRAQIYSYTCVPDPRRDAGDSIRCSLMDGTTTVAQIASITHPLVADAKQTITTVSTQEELPTDA